MYTDSNPSHTSCQHPNMMGQCWVARLVRYNFKTHYKLGKQKVKADKLSRIPWQSEEGMVTTDQLTIKAIMVMGMMG